jgi:putative hydrolase of HD superfamily
MNMEQKQPVFSGELTDFLKFNEFLNKFRRIRRLLWYKGNASRERNGDHCFHVAMMAWFANERLGLKLDLSKLITYALVHDLPEVYAKDTPNVPAHLEGKYGPGRGDKKEREAKAIKRIEKEWGKKFPALLKWIHAYESHSDKESRFIVALDKLLSQMNIYQDHGRSDKKVGVPLEFSRNYKRGRVLHEPTILRLFDELHAIWSVDFTRQYQP